MTYKFSDYSVMYREDWHNLLSLCYKLNEFFTMFIQSKHSDCSLCADEMSTNLRFKKEITEIN